MMVFIRLLGKNIILWMICNRKKEMKKEKEMHTNYAKIQNVWHSKS